MKKERERRVMEKRVVKRERLLRGSISRSYPVTPTPEAVVPEQGRAPRDTAMISKLSASSWNPRNSSLPERTPNPIWSNWCNKQDQPRLHHHLQLCGKGTVQSQMSAVHSGTSPTLARSSGLAVTTERRCHLFTICSLSPAWSSLRNATAICCGNPLSFPFDPLRMYPTPHSPPRTHDPLDTRPKLART